jgi:coenzyme F420 biosynthesis associated uncharacterized protein
MSGASTGSPLPSDDHRAPDGVVPVAEPAASGDGRAPNLIDERVALWAARLTAPKGGSDPVASAALRAEISADLPAIDAAAREFSRLGADLDPTRVRVIGRISWVRANLAGLRGAFDPLGERLQGRRVIASRVLGVQLGALLGLLSGKVLGQYVLPLGRGEGGGGELVVVGPNVLELGEDDPDLAVDVRRTVLLHEITHRLQFDATPWLAGHLQGLLDRYLEHARLDPTSLLEAAPRLPEAIAEVKSTGTITPLVEAVLTPEQVDVLAEAQGLMSLLEGHGNTVMFDAGDDLVGDADAVRDALAARRGDVTSKVLTAVAGLETKRRQYREGEAFVRGVVEIAGIDGLNRAFERPENLPRGEEVDDPAGWLARVDGS